MIPGPCSFWLRPGQRIEVRDAHKLASDQYLVVKVYAEVDKSAPFYEVTAKSAAITRATAKNVRDDKTTGASTRIDQLPPLELRRGQLIVIRGLDTQLYIPLTGVDIVPDTSVDDTGGGMTAAAARQLLPQLPCTAPQPGGAADPGAVRCDRGRAQRGAGRLDRAMTALSDKIMLAEVAENMNLVTLFKGKEVGTILSEVLGGTKLMPTIRALIEKFGPPSLAASANGDSTAKPA